jgi:hypothetical protein
LNSPSDVSSPEILLTGISKTETLMISPSNYSHDKGSSRRRLS